MQLSYNWLKNYLPKEIAPDELSKILTGIGLEVEESEKREAVPGGMQGLVVGLVETCQHHENSDKLSVTTVRINANTVLPIVCGAPNVKAGQKVIVATVGTELPASDGGTFKIKKAKIRGAESEGMICAEDEIGMGKSHDGILVLPEDTPVGLPAADYFKLPPPDYIFTIGLTPNRSDANCHLGTAKDVCAYLSYHLQEKIKPILPVIKPHLFDKKENLPLSVEIVNKEACLRYAGLVLTDISIKPSPEWLQQKLKAVGIHPINNVVDVTNFVLQEYGQPLHAFDYDKIGRNKIIVQSLKEGTPFQVLDGTEIKLSSEDLMICDGDQTPMCMAGVYGGADSGISGNTKTIFLESAYFYPRNIRRSSVRHGFRTEAATHFEKGVAMQNILPALQRAAALITEVAGGKVASPLIDNYPHSQPDKKIPFSFEYLNKICGKTFNPVAVQLLLETLGFTSTLQADKGLLVKVPFENQDIHQPADLAEEVLRIDGLDNIPIPTTIRYSLGQSNSAKNYRSFKERIAEYIAGCGFQEIITNSISNSKLFPKYGNMVHLLNSLTSELDVLRPQMLESGLEVIAYNQNRKMTDVSIFEIGKTFTDEGSNQYNQTEWLSIWSTGNIRQADWGRKAEATGLFVLKGLINTLFTLTGLKNIQESVQEGHVIWKRGKQEIGYLCTVNPADRKRFDLKQNVYYAAIRLENLFDAIKNQTIKYREVPKYPAAKRDLALIFSKAITYGQVSEIIRQQKIEALQNFELFDIFENEKIGKDNKSMALSFTFQLKDRTLTDAEVDEMLQKLSTGFEKKLNATVRS